MDTSTSSNESIFRTLKTWRAKLSPVFGAVILGVFGYWVYIYWGNIISALREISLIQLSILLAWLFISGLLTALAFVLIVREVGYPFRFLDGFHTLNYSQLASMIPGGIWGYAGLAGVLWSKGISKADSILVIFLNTLLMLSACAVVGIAGLSSILGWKFALLSLLPLLFVLLGRDVLDKIRNKFIPGSSPLPSRLSLIKILFLGIIVWIIASSCFTWLLYGSVEGKPIPFWIISGGYAAGYLGGYITLIAPSGIGISEGLIAIILRPYIATETVLAVAISFRILQTVVIWCNILITALFGGKSSRSQTI